MLNNDKKNSKMFFLGIVSLLLIPFYFLLFYYPDEWIAWLLVAISYICPIIFYEVRKDNRLLMIMYLSISIHHIFAIYNSFIDQTDLVPDAEDFYKEASIIAWSNNIDIDFSSASIMYTNLLAYFLKYLGNSFFLVSELSILAFTFSIIVIIKLSILLKIKKGMLLTVLLFSMLPTTFLFTSLPMREAFQILFFLMSSYYGVLLLNNIKISVLLKFLSSLILLSIWHNGLMIISPIILFVIVLYSLSGDKYKVSIGIKVILGIVFFSALSFSFFLIGNSDLSSNAASSLVEGEGLSYADEYRSRARDAGSEYSAVMDSSSLFGLLKTVPIVFLSYMFAPFPWQIRNIVDIYVFFEGILRFIFMVSSIKLIRRSKGIERQSYSSLFVIYIISELIWALGTSNWGTAMRHHLVSYGIILLLGIKGFYENNSKVQKSVDIYDNKT